MHCKWAFHSVCIKSDNDVIILLGMLSEMANSSLCSTILAVLEQHKLYFVHKQASSTRILN